jgi:Tfp pilus assembly protein PilF
MQESGTLSAFQELYNRGFQQGKNGLYQDAINTFSQAILIAPDEPIGYIARASAYLSLEDSKSALVDFERAVQLYKDRGEVDYAKQLEGSLKSIRRS